MTPAKWDDWYLNNYGGTVQAAQRFAAIDPYCDFSLLAASWNHHNKNGTAIDPVFSFTELIDASKKEGFIPHPCARVIDARWKSYARFSCEEQ